MTASIADVIGNASIIPVLQIDSVEVAVPLAGILIEEGLDVLEITLRTDAAFGATAAIMRNFPKAKIGLGTVTSAAGFAQAADLNVAFVVSPGLTSRLATEAAKCGIPYLPGVTTVSEIILALEYGFTELKFYPAEQSGGAKMLKAFQPLFPDARFCPTGGIRSETLASYLGLANVFAVGGTWLAPAEMIAKQDWQGISRNVQEAVKIARTV